jgi:polyphosphate glucokinase
MKVLVVDVGGTHLKLAVSGRRTPRQLPSGPTLTPAHMVRAVREATRDWTYDAVTIGYPGPVVAGRPLTDPHNLGRGWTRFDYRRAFGRPVRVMNDAAMQALGSYSRGRMLFLGLGTGLGTALVDDGHVIALELAHLPYENGRTYEDVLGIRGLQRLGPVAWRRQVVRIVALLRAATVADEVVIGGGNVHRLPRLPRGCRRGDNRYAFRGGERAWRE